MWKVICAGLKTDLRPSTRFSTHLGRPNIDLPPPEKCDTVTEMIWGPRGRFFIHKHQVYLSGDVESVMV